MISHVLGVDKHHIGSKRNKKYLIVRSLNLKVQLSLGIFIYCLKLEIFIPLYALLTCRVDIINLLYASLLFLSIFDVMLEYYTMPHFFIAICNFTSFYHSFTCISLLA